MTSKRSFPSPTLLVLSFARYWKYEIMDKDQVVGSAKQVKGAVEESVGRAVGDAKLESEGQADKVDGKIRNAIGRLRDRLKGK
jgi:uncharacterized protein YjbJ (UPF0337 family)